MAEIIVTSTADSGAGSLRQAIADAQDGDVILFDADVFPAGQTTSILLSSYITVNKSISIYGGESDGNGGYTSGATKQYYVYREIEGVKTKVYTDETPAQDGETVLFELVCRVVLDGQNAARCVYMGSNITSAVLWSGLTFINGATTTNGGGFYINGLSQNTLNDCSINSCSANNGGGFDAISSSQNTLNNCVISGCNATSSGGSFFSGGSSQNTLNTCIFDDCSAANGGATSSYDTSQNTLNGCTITNCNATTNGGGVYASGTSQNTLNGCVFKDCSATATGGAATLTSTSVNTLITCQFIHNITNNAAVFATGTSQDTFDGCILDTDSPFTFASSSFVTISGGVTLIAKATIGAGLITIADGAALTITDSASIVSGAAFTSSGRGYLATEAGIDVSAATLTNVVLCAYGADVSSFAEVDGVLEWDADDPSVSVLLEREDNDAWTTLAQTTGESLDYYLPPKVNLRLFDGERFLTTATPDSRTYFYIGGAEGSFDDAEDWSLTKDGTAIPQSPTITDCAFVIQGAEGDVAISKGSANVTNATIIPAGTNDIAVVVDEATVLAGTERFTGTLTTTGDVTIAGDASKLAIVVDGTLEVAGSLKLATLTLTSGSSVVFASADDVLVVTDSATVNDATFSCEEPTAYFTAPVGTDLTQATFTNVYVATKGAEVESVTGSRFGKNYSINIISEDNTLPVTVEYRLEGTTEWIVADPAFVGTTFQIRLDDEATFRVYNGEKFTEATMKVYGLYNEMAAIVEIGYLI